mgnify:CR=1 FL=1
MSPLRSRKLPHLILTLAGFALSSAMVSLTAGPVMARPTAAMVDAKYTPASEEARKAIEVVYRQHLITLADPWFEGRAPGTRGNADAADYLEFYFRRYGLSPAFPEEAASGQEAKPFSSYRQEMTPARLRTGQLVVESQTMTVAGKTLAGGTDFGALGLSGSGSAAGTIAFVGYGIESGRDGYKGFPDGTDLKGKIALVLRFEPMKEDGTSKWSDRGWSPASGLAAKLAAVASKGAAGIIVVNAPGAKDPRMGRLATINETRQGTAQSIPVVMVSEEAAESIVKAADAQGRSLTDLRRQADEQGVVIDLPAAKVELDVKLKTERTTSPNVAGILKGKGALADEYIVIGAHYDHVGYGEFGSMSGETGKIHPGADDNASGTSGVLVLAKKLAEYYATLPADANMRSILFMGFTAEESGLEGSRHYTRNMIAPKEKHYLMINLDMVGRLRDEPPMEVSGLGSAGGLADWAKPFFDNAGFNILPKVTASQFDGRSDQASFHAVGIPNMFFFTGLHNDYHRPIDTAEKVNIEGAAKIVDLAGRMALDAAARTEPFPFGKAAEPPAGESPAKPIESAPARPAPAADNPAPVGPGGGVRFGVMPADYADDVPGVLIGQVFPNTPAAKAGLKDNDRMVKWNGKAIKAVEDWTPLLRAQKPGDKVEVTFTRDGKEMTVTVELEARTGEPAR